MRCSQAGARKGSSSRPRLHGDLALVRAHDAQKVRFQPAAPLAFGDALEGLDSLRRHGLAAVETGLAEARTDQYAHELPAALARLVSPTYGERASGRGLCGAKLKRRERRAC